MSLLFRPWTNTFSRSMVIGLPIGAIAFFGALMIYVRSPYFTNQQNPVVQPIQFDHRHHVADDGIDCRYCHMTVEKAASAGYPSTSTCLNCHSQIWNKSPLLAPLRASFFTGQSISWRRVHRLPDFVYFNHAIHMSKGVGCETCHGRIDQMPSVVQVAPLTMGWCLDCHRAPERYLRPKDEVTSMTWKADNQLALGRDLVRRYAVHTRTSCTTCHR